MFALNFVWTVISIVFENVGTNKSQILFFA